MLPQPIHILRKDTRHLWPEILVVLLLFVAFAAAAPSHWANTDYAPYVAFLAGLLKVLLPVSWLVLISRLIHDESLVGDRQFWTSRPYHWAKLLAAKLLFLVLFLYLPFLLMQVYLLKHAGLHPTLVIPALLHNLLLLTSILVIPFSALAAVTSTFPRLLLTTLGALVYLLVLVGVTTFLSFLHMMPPHFEWLFNILFIVLPAAVLLYQYATRNTLVSRIALAATPLLAILIYALLPTSALLARAYPPLSGSSAPTLTSLAAQFHPNATGKPRTLRGFVYLSLPVSVQGIDKDTDFAIEGTRITVSGPGIPSYTSPFLTTPAPTDLNLGTPRAVVVALLPQSVYDQAKGKPVNVHLELAVQHLQVGKPSTWRATLQPFSIPGNALCTFAPDDASQPPSCRYPFSMPSFTFVTAPLSSGACSTPSAAAMPGRARLSAPAAPLDFDPVLTEPLAFQPLDGGSGYVLCPGTDLQFTVATLLPRASLLLDSPNTTLDPFIMRVATAQDIPNPTASPRAVPEAEPDSAPAPTRSR